MGFLLFLLFVGMPILEIVVFIQLGGLIGLWPTLAGIVATAVIGVALLRHQGFTVLRRAYQTANAGQMPVAEVFDGFCLVIAGAFLLTPGFVTDTLGFLLLVPALRRWLRATFGERLIRSGRMRVHIDGEPVGPGPSRPRDSKGVVIDADYETLDPTSESSRPATGEDGRGGEGALQPPSQPQPPKPDKSSPWSS